MEKDISYKKPNLKSNTLLNLSIQVISYLTPLITSPYLSRILGAENIGIYSFAFSFTHYFVLFAAFGFTDFGARIIAKNNDFREKYSLYFWNVLFVRLFFTTVAILVFLFCFFVGLSPGQFDLNIYLALLIIIVSCAFDVTFFFRGREKFKYVSFVTAIINLLYIISIFLFVKSSNDLLLFTILKSSISLFVSLFLWFIALTDVSKPKINKKIMIECLIGGVSFFLPTLVMSISGSIDQTLIGVFSNNIQVAFYQQISKITSLLFSITYAFSPVVLSRISYLTNDNDKNAKDIKNISENFIALSLFLLLPCVIGLYITGNIFIPLFFGEEFNDATFTLFAMLPSAIFSSIASILINTSFFPRGKTKAVTIVIGISVLLNILFTSLLLTLTNLGSVGAALVTSLCNMFIMIVLFIYLKDDISLLNVAKKSWKSFVASFVMTIFVLLLNYVITLISSDIKSAVFLLVDIISGALIYFLVSLLLKEKIILSFFNFLRDKLFNK